MQRNIALPFNGVRATNNLYAYVLTFYALDAENSA